MFLNARSQQSFRGAMPAENTAVLTDTSSHRGQAWRQETLSLRDTCLQMSWFQLPALLHAKVCMLTAFCANTVGCQFLSCTSWYVRLGQGGDLSKELNQNVPFSLHTPHQSFLNNNKRKFLSMLNPNPNNSQRLENSSLTHRWEIPGRLSSSIKQIDKIETYTNRIPAKLLLLLITESSSFL